MRRWMSCYVLLGLVQSGMLPIILPLAAPPGPEAGLSYAAYAIAGIAAPFVGAASDRLRRHRLTLALGLSVGAGGLFAMELVGRGVALHIALAALVGFGVSSASTVGTMFVVEVEAEEAWDPGIGALQGAISLGQVVGLLLAGALGLALIHLAFWIAGVILLIGVPLALTTAPDPLVKVARHELAPRPSRAGELAGAGPQRSLHRLTARALSSLSHSRLAAFLATWLLSYAATNALAVMFAVVMVRTYHASASWPTSAYAIGVGVSLLLYRFVGGWDRRFGPWPVLVTGFGGRFLVVAIMAVAAALMGGGSLWIELVCFSLTQMIWPLLSVASTALAIRLSPAHQAEAVGLLNATSSLGATIGGVVAGSLLAAGFAWFCLIVCLSLATALLLSRLQMRPPAPPAPAQAAGPSPLAA